MLFAVSMGKIWDYVSDPSHRREGFAYTGPTDEAAESSSYDYSQWVCRGGTARIG